MCPQQPPCPPAEATDHEAARARSVHPSQGRTRHAVLLFEDTGQLLPTSKVIAPHRPTDFGAAA
ncbi:hypothetical protein GPA10_37155 [Streptomyces sp. p1417]|uniref:Uncharacterized protein n=1 Tax=Streptomyces typhae TaxID=2681492 RepID=A0A6L6X8S2_9ACTN|nr:DUF5999 family protein [Streptomyces typhae]MVO90232.1 hypothetical protein [Streptomyces typhae]